MIISKNSKKVNKNIYKIYNNFIIIDKIELQRIRSEEIRQWQPNWEDEVINDNYENKLKLELIKYA